MFKNLFVFLVLVAIIAPYVPAVYYYALEHATIAHGIISYLLITIAMAVADQGGEPTWENE